MQNRKIKGKKHEKDKIIREKTKNIKTYGK